MTPIERHARIFHSKKSFPTETVSVYKLYSLERILTCHSSLHREHVLLLLSFLFFQSLFH